MIPCKLVHDTGTMIRFRTSQLGLLPDESGAVDILLPTGRIVPSFFNRHPRNPNVSGAELVRWIKARVPWKKREDVLVERRSVRMWALHLVCDFMAIAMDAGMAASSARSGALSWSDLDGLLALADREADKGARSAWYRRVLRPSGLRRMVLGLVGARCMADECDACERFVTEWWPESGRTIVDVHHVEQLAHVVDHTPKNLCVLCANHHRFIHGSGKWNVRHDGVDVVMRRVGRELVIRRPPVLFGTRPGPQT